MRTYDWLSTHASRIPSKLAQIDVDGGRSFDYAAMNERVAALAGYLRDELSIGPADRVAVLGPNSSDIFEIQFACARLGAIFVPLNTRLAIPELVYMLDDVGARVLLCGREFDEAGRTLREHCRLDYVIGFNGDGSDSDYERGLDGARPVHEIALVDQEDTWTILYTSGTTGRPKGARITYGMTLAHAVNLSFPARLGSDSVNLCTLPMFHVSGLNVFANPAFHAGGANVIVRKFDAARLLSLIGDDEYGITHFMGVPSMYQFMAQEPVFAATDFSRVAAAFVGGAPCPESLLRACFDAGLRLSQGYGMTETGPAVLLLDPVDAQRKIGSSGKPLMHVDLKLVAADGTPAEDGEVGEIWVKGPSITPGYWQRPDADTTDFTDGWLRTGDAAYRDEEGDYFIVDRWKDMYISGGENVYPAEVENVISNLDQVLEVAVIGVPHEKWGETGAAFVVLRPQTDLSAEAVTQHCLEHLAKYKAPQRIYFVEDLPHTASGKVAKAELGQMLRANDIGPEMGGGG